MEKSKDQEIQSDMRTRIGKARTELSAILVALGRFAAHENVQNAVRAIISATDRVQGAETLLTEVGPDYIARPDKQKPAVGWLVDVTHEDTAKALRTVYAQDSSVDKALHVFAVVGNTAHCKSRLGTTLMLPLSKLAAASLIQDREGTSDHRTDCHESDCVGECLARRDVA